MSKWVEVVRGMPVVTLLVTLLGLVMAAGIVPATAVAQTAAQSAAPTAVQTAASGGESVEASSWAQAVRLTVAEAVQHALVRAPELEMAKLSIAEADIALQDAVIGRLAGQPASAYEDARDRVQEARDNYTDQLVQVALNVEEAYYNALRAAELLQIQQGNQEQADRQLAVARARFEAGLIARQDFLEAQLNHAESTLQLDNARRSYADAIDRLVELMGMPVGTPIVLVEEVGFAPWRIELEEALEEALSQRQEIVRAQRAIEKARLQVAHADTPYTAPVELEKARLNLRRAEVQHEQARLQVMTQVRTEWAQLMDAERQVEMTRRKEELARSRAEISRARYDAGLISLLDLLRDEAEYAQARLNAAGAVWDYNLRQARFLRTLGRPELPPLPEPIADYMAGWEELE